MGSHRCVGVVKRVDPKTNNFGFLKQFHKPEDLYVHKRNLLRGMALTVDDVLEYDAVPDPSHPQKDMAVNVIPAVQKTGKVIMYDDGQEFGFILSDPVGDEAAEKFYVKRKDTNGPKLDVDEKVVFYSTYDRDDGLPRAVLVTGPGGAVVGSGGGGADSLCYKCGKIGHRASVCANPGANPTGEGSDDGCWRCGKDDHFSRNCPGNN